MADVEQFSFKKFVKGFDPLNGTLWAKTAAYSIRLLIVVAVAAAGWGWWEGRKSKPADINLNDSVIELTDQNGAHHKLVIKNKQMEFDGKLVRAKDIPGLRPYGIELHPKLATGITSAGHPAAGVALEVAHFYNFNLDLLAMVPFIGAGVSYDLHFNGPIKIDNTSVGIGIGEDLESKTPSAILYMGIEF